MRFSVLTAAVSAATLGFVVTPAYAADHACANTVQAELTRMDIASSDVTKVVYDEDNNQGQVSSLLTAWIYLKDQPGVMTINMTPKCQVLKVQARYGMKMPGVKKS